MTRLEFGLERMIQRLMQMPGHHDLAEVVQLELIERWRAIGFTDAEIATAAREHGFLGRALRAMRGMDPLAETEAGLAAVPDAQLSFFDVA